MIDESLGIGLSSGIWPGCGGLSLVQYRRAKAVGYLVRDGHPDLHQAGVARGNRSHVYGDGSQRRCFCDVRDVVAAITLLAEGNRHTGKVFNVGSQEETTILGLARANQKS